MATAAIILAGGDGTRLRSLTRRSLATVLATG
jgi:dTDP-glucose pyrophosphorylase